MALESRTISLGGDMGRWSDYALDTFFAPHLSELTAFSAPDVPVMDDYTLSFILNRAINAPDEARVKASMILIASFIRHAGPAIIEYREACLATMAYVSALPSRTATSIHAIAVARFENCLIQLSAAQSRLSALSDLFPQHPPMFTPQDDSDHARLAKLANRIRHFHEDITNVASKREPGPFPLAPIWLTNTSIKCRKNTTVYELTYQELAALLIDAIATAKNMAEGAVPTSKAPA